MSNGGDDEFIKAMQRAKLRAETFSDHQNAIAGRETGRILPRVGQNAPSTDSQRAKRFSETVDLIANLQALLQDPEYAKAYTRVKGLLEKAERLTENALVQAEAALEEIIARAVKLPDGRAVFRDRSGNVRTEGGVIIDAAIAAGIDWPDDAPSYEELGSWKRWVDGLREYQVDTLGRVRDRLEDENNPPSIEELEEFEQEIRKQRPELEAETNEPENPKSSDPIRSSEIQVPDL